MCVEIIQAEDLKINVKVLGERYIYRAKFSFPELADPALQGGKERRKICLLFEAHFYLYIFYS